MKMKKYLLSFAVMLMGTPLFTACDNDNENHGSGTVVVSDGVYVVCSGNMASGIDGALTYYDYANNQTFVDAFKSANGKSLGMTVNDALRYGNKLYIVVDGEHTVFVTDAKSLRLLATIDMTAPTMLGEEGGVSPRRITADGGNIYVSTFGGYVAAIDTVNYALTKKYKAGSYPEGVAVANGILYVANSDYGNGNASISRINLQTGEDTPLVNENVRNPQTIAIAGLDIYFLDYGQYGPAPTYAQEHAGVYCATGNIVRQLVPNATAMGTAGYAIYTINAPYGGPAPTYSIYNIQSGTLSSFDPVDIEYPAAIEVDPVQGNVIIASYQKSGEWADYAANGYVNIYDATVTSKKASFECGVGPQRIVINLGTKYVVY